MIRVYKIPNINTIVIKKSDGDPFFLLTTDSFIITPSNLAYLLKSLIKHGIISKKLLEGVLNELSD
jgi:hypothetical protein